MKPRVWTSLFMFLSAYFPLAIILLVKDYNWESLADGRIIPFAHLWSAIIIILIAFFSVVALGCVIASLSNGPVITVRQVDNRSNELVNYTIPYLASFFGFQIGNEKDTIIFCIFLVLMWLLTHRTQSLFLNPLLAILGYGLFDVNYTYAGAERKGIFLSKKDLVSGQSYRVERLTRFLLFVTTDLKKEKELDENKAQQITGTRPNQLNSYSVGGNKEIIKIGNRV